jgi:hypothetical protein
MAMMLTDLLRVAVPAILAGVLALPVAHAEIYTWIDASGGTNVSNLPPPDGAKVTKVQHSLPPEIAAREDAARDAARRAEAQALTERVHQLEDEAALAASRAPLPDYRPAAPPPVVQYIVEPQPAPMQQAIETARPQSLYGYGGCDPTWWGCGLSWFPGVYPASVIVVRSPGFRSPRPPHNGQNVTGPRLPPPFGHPLVPQFPGPMSHNVAAQQATHSVNPLLGFKRG